MRREAMNALRCPRCKADGSFELAAERDDEREVREGDITCTACGERRRIRRGIVDLMPEVPEFVRREAAGLDRFAVTMRNDGWDRERVLSLPYLQHGYWYAQATMMHQVLHTVPMQRGDTLLDVGSNTCWAGALLAERRGVRVTALDINASEMQGLATADWWHEARGVHMERVLGVMFDISLASDSQDWVWCSEVLHHNHRANLWATMRELHRVLKPGGSVIVVNEPLRSLRQPHLRPGEDVEEYEGHEHAYLRASYVKAARDAGFEVDVRGPWLHLAFCEELFGISPRMRIREGFQAAAAHAIRRSPRIGGAYLAWKAYVAGGTSLHMLATKP